jgi:hypothetical protein
VVQRGTRFDKRVALVDRPGGRARWRSVSRSSSSDVVRPDRRKRNKLDGIDLDLSGAGPIAAIPIDAWLLAPSDGERDVAGEVRSSHNTSLEAGRPELRADLALTVRQRHPRACSPRQRCGDLGIGATASQVAPDPLIADGDAAAQ